MTSGFIVSKSKKTAPTAKKHLGQAKQKAEEVKRKYDRQICPRKKAFGCDPLFLPLGKNNQNS